MGSEPTGSEKFGESNGNPQRKIPRKNPQRKNETETGFMNVFM